MKKAIAAVLSVFFIAGGCVAGEKITDKERFERDYLDCMAGGFKNKCFSGVVRGHFDPWTNSDNEAKLLAGTEAFLDRWVGGSAIYKVHSVGAAIKAGVFDNRVYLVERSDGELAAFIIGYRKVKGDWFLYEVEGGTSDKFVRGLLDMPKFSSAD